MAKIQVFTVLGKNGIMCANFLRTTMESLSSKEHDISYQCFMSSGAEAPKGWKYLEHILKQKHTSLNHTTGLNRALDYINGDYVILTDADIAMLTVNWDKKIIDYLESENIFATGVTFWDRPQNYKKFPAITFFVAKSIAHLRAAPDLRPQLHEYSNHLGTGAMKRSVESHQEAFFWGLRKGSRIHLDSGWQLPIKYKELGFRGTTFKEMQQYALGEQVPQSWELNGEPIVSHKGKSSKRRQSHCMKFSRDVAKYINKTHKVSLDEYLR